MKQIKTIRVRLDSAESFDERVNAALAEGWELKKREYINTHTERTYIMLYAELEREVEPEKVEVERRCSNCRHVENPPFAWPCSVCTHDNHKWELKEG